MPGDRRYTLRFKVLFQCFGCTYWTEIDLRLLLDLSLTSEGVKASISPISGVGSPFHIGSRIVEENMVV